MSTTVHDQAELNAAVAARAKHIEIRSPKGVWLRVKTPRATRVEARGSSSVVAWGSSSVVARGSSSVVAWGSSSVVAWESSSVEARGSSSVEAWESSSVEARESSSVEARGSSSVHSRDRSKVTAASHVGVHLHSAHAVVEGGVLIDVIDAERDPAGWCDFHGIEVIEGVATVYKAVDDSWTTDRGFDYSPGATPVAPDWRPDNSCGGGLHFAPTPRHSLDYYSSATRFVAVGVAVADLMPILDGGTAKCKAPRVVRPCVEVDIKGRAVEPVTA